MQQHGTSRAGDTRPTLTLPCSQQARRQHKRLCWIIVIVGALLLANILATISGLGNPLYKAFHPAAVPSGATGTASDNR